MFEPEKVDIANVFPLLSMQRKKELTKAIKENKKIDEV
jgi:hypothetical protein